MVGVPTPASGRIGVGVAVAVVPPPDDGVGVAMAHTQSESAVQEAFLQLPFEQTSPVLQSEFVLHELLHDAGGVGVGVGVPDAGADGGAEGDGEAVPVLTSANPRLIHWVLGASEGRMTSAAGLLVGAFGATDSCLS